MIIILEGPDNAGKSSLAKRLSCDLHVEVIHPGGPPKNIVEAIARCFEQERTFEIGTQLNIIFDRVTCISDMIYRGIPEYHNVFGLFQDQIRYRKNIVVIYCRPSIERLRNFDDHVTKDHEDESVVQHAKDNVERIIFEYDNVMLRLESDPHVDFQRYNFEQDDDSEEYMQLHQRLYDMMDIV